MRYILRLVAMAGAAALVMFGLVPTAQAATTTVTVFDAEADEGNWVCTAEVPYGCSIRNGLLVFAIHIARQPNRDVTLGWRLEDITATAGQDYTGPTAGTIIYPANGTRVFVTVPVVRDSVTEPAETLRLRITSSSVTADISDVGIGTISDGVGDVPADCTVTQTNSNNMFLTCTNRPATQRWYLVAECVNPFPGLGLGNIVTGNGTSAVTCDGPAFVPHFVEYVEPEDPPGRG
jgi:hypothetical protein